MKSRISVNIAGENYVIGADDDEAYVRKVAAMVDEKVSEIIEATKMSKTSAAILAAANFADDYMKTLDACDNMRVQMKSYLEDASRLRTELNDTRRELNKLKAGK